MPATSQAASRLEGLKMGKVRREGTAGYEDMGVGGAGSRESRRVGTGRGMVLGEGWLQVSPPCHSLPYTLHSCTGPPTPYEPFLSKAKAGAEVPPALGWVFKFKVGLSLAMLTGEKSSS